MGKRGVSALLVAVTSLLWMAAPPPAQAGYVIDASFSGTVSYSSPLTLIVTSRSATLTSTTCVHEGAPTPSKGPIGIPVLPPCTLTLTFPLNITGAACVPVGATAVGGSFTGVLGGTWTLTGGVLTPNAVFGGGVLVVQGQATQTGTPFQTGVFTVVAALAPLPLVPVNCLTNTVQSFAVGEFQLVAPL